MTITGAVSNHFPLPLVGEFQDNGRRLKLVSRFVFYDGGERIEIPPNFVTDFNSIPRPLWVWFPPWEFPEAGLVHDFLYRYPSGRSRGRCDSIHGRILELKGCRVTKRSAVRTGLWLGGWRPWNAYRKAER
jgi:hypothetical protein